MPNYPVVNGEFETRLRAIKMSAGEMGAAYLQHPDCPWPSSLKELLRPLIAREKTGPTVAENVFEGLEEGDKFDLLIKEIEITITSMRDLETSVQGEGMERADQVQVIKAKTSLLEKWVSLKERTYTMKEMSEFQRLVLEVLDSVLTVDQRGAVLERFHHLKSMPAKNKEQAAGTAVAAG